MLPPLPLGCILDHLCLLLCRLMESYRRDAEQHGAVVALNCEVVGGKVSGAAMLCIVNFFMRPACVLRQLGTQAACAIESCCSNLLSSLC